MQDIREMKPPVMVQTVNAIDWPLTCTLNVASLGLFSTDFPQF